MGAASDLAVADVDAEALADAADDAALVLLLLAAMVEDAALAELADAATLELRLESSALALDEADAMALLAELMALLTDAAVVVPLSTALEALWVERTTELVAEATPRETTLVVYATVFVVSRVNCGV